MGAEDVLVAEEAMLQGMRTDFEALERVQVGPHAHQSASHRWLQTCVCSGIRQSSLDARRPC